MSDPSMGDLLDESLTSLSDFFSDMRTQQVIGIVGNTMIFFGGIFLTTVFKIFLIGFLKVFLIYILQNFPFVGESVAFQDVQPSNDREAFNQEYYDEEVEEYGDSGLIFNGIWRNILDWIVHGVI